MSCSTKRIGLCTCQSFEDAYVAHKRIITGFMQRRYKLTREEAQDAFSCAVVRWYEQNWQSRWNNTYTYARWLFYNTISYITSPIKRGYVVHVGSDMLAPLDEEGKIEPAPDSSRVTEAKQFLQYLLNRYGSFVLEMDSTQEEIRQTNRRFMGKSLAYVWQEKHKFLALIRQNEGHIWRTAQ